MKCWPRTSWRDGRGWRERLAPHDPADTGFDGLTLAPVDPPARAEAPSLAWLQRGRAPTGD